jgi:iron complex outermembrane recepter protein
MIRHWESAFIGLLTSALCVSSGEAQQVTGPTELTELVVTAQKRPEPFSEVPISIAVLGAETLQNTGVRQLREVSRLTPNLRITPGNDTTTAIRIRGVGANTRNVGFDTRVGVYVDGVYLGQSPAQNIDILDLERVEVMRGPQGTLFGKNTVAGAINLVTRKPGSELELAVRGEYGNLNSHRLSALANIPIGERLATRISVVDHQRDGYVRNITTGSAFAELDGTTVRGQLRYAGERVEVIFSGDHMQSDRVSFNGEAVTDWSGSVIDTLAPARLEISNNVDNRETRDISGLSATANLQLGRGHSLTSTTAYRDTSARRIQDTDYSALDILVVDYPDAYRHYSQELQVSSPDRGPLQYVAGLYLYEERATTKREPFVGSEVGVVLAALGNPLAPFGPAFEGSSVATLGGVDTSSRALYFNATYDLTERLTVGVGARYTDETKDVDFVLSGDVVDLGFTQVPVAGVLGVAIGPIVGNRSVATYEDTRSYSDLSTSLSMTFALAENANLYARYAEAFKSGGFNVDFVSQDLLDNGLGFDAETVQAYEIGIKASVLDERLRYSLSAYQMDFSDYQLNQFVDLGNNLSAITIRNAASVRSRGVEAEFTWFPSDRLMLHGAVGTVDARFRSFPGGASARNPAGLGADLAGNRLASAPKLTSALAVQYEHPLRGGGRHLIARMDWSYTDGLFTTEDNVQVARPGSSIAFGEVGSHSLLGGRVGIEFGDTASVSLWARNLLDSKYAVSNGADFFGTIAEYPGAPRTYGVEVAHRFR